MQPLANGLPALTDHLSPLFRPGFAFTPCIAAGESDVSRVTPRAEGASCLALKAMCLSVN
jgi:hypothetical protein